MACIECVIVTKRCNCWLQVDNVGLLSLEGVPGASLPAAMASAHRTAVESTVASGRKAATRRELRQWAALTRMLIARCWTVQAALAAAWHQVRGFNRRLQRLSLDSTPICR